MEPTILFYGAYFDRQLAIATVNNYTHSYSLPLAYILVTMIVLGLSLILMVRQ